MKKETRKKLLIMLFVITLAAVWGQSFIGKQASESASDIFVDMIQPLEEIKPDPETAVPTLEYDFLSHLVRKGAHVFEYTIIGIELMLIFILFCIQKPDKYIVYFINCIMIGMFIGIVDETIQVFSERGSQIKDVWFDSIGIAIGAGFICIINVLKSKKSGRLYEENTDNRS